MQYQYPRYAKVVFSNGIKKFDVANLRVVFEVQKGLGMTSSLCELKVYNLSKETRALISGGYAQVQIWVGNSLEDVSLLFDGDVTNVFHRRESGTDIETLCYCKEGHRFLTNSTSKGSYPAGTRFDILFTSLVKDLTYNKGGVSSKVGIGEINIDVAGVNITKLGDSYPAARLGRSGVTIQGKTSDMLDLLADSYRFNWFIVNGKFYAVGEARTLVRFPTVRISQTTGMIGSPTITITGMEARTLLNPQLSPGGQVSIVSVGNTVQFPNMGFYNVPDTIGGNSTGGVRYKVIRVTHTGDTRGNEWYSDVETLNNWPSIETVF